MSGSFTAGVGCDRADGDPQQQHREFLGAPFCNVLQQDQLRARQMTNME